MIPSEYTQAARPSRLERALGTAVLASLVLSPLVFVPSGVRPPLVDIATNLHGVSRGLVLQDRTALPQFMIANLSSAVVLVLLLWWSRSAPGLGRLERAWCVALVALGGLAIAGVALASPSLHETVVTLRPYLPYTGMLGVFWATLLCRAARRAAWTGTLAVGAIMALLVLAEEWGAPMPGSGEPWIDPPTATLTHRNAVALTLLAAVPMAYASAALESRRRRAIALAALFGLLIGGLFGTRSRTCILAAIAGLACAAWCVPALRRIPARRWALVGAAALAGLGAHAASPLANKNVPLTEKLARAAQTLFAHRALAAPLPAAAPGPIVVAPTPLAAAPAAAAHAPLVVAPLVVAPLVVAPAAAAHAPMGAAPGPRASAPAALVAAPAQEPLAAAPLVAAPAQGPVAAAPLAAAPAPAPPTDAGITQRIVQWRFSLRQIAASPLYGIGLGNYRMLSQHVYPDSWQPHAHNVLLQTTVELGLPILALALVMLAALAVAGRRLVRRSPTAIRPLVGVSVLVALAVAGLLESYLHTVGPNLIAAAFAGAVLGWSEDAARSVA